MDNKQIENHPVIRGLIQELADRYKQSIIKSNSVATGNILKFSFDISVSEHDFEIEFNLPVEWKYVEYGRRPGKQPPTNAIEKWIRVKPLIPRAVNGKVPSTKQTAFVIARSIGRHGVKGKHLLSKTINTADDIMSRLKQEITNLVLDQMVKEINKQAK